MTITYGSVCSGIEAASVAWAELDMKAAWFSQFDPEHNYSRGPDFPSSVLAKHWPDVKNIGDMTKIAEQVIAGSVSAPDVVVGGTPCQAFSVAGSRAGLSDPRGQLTLSYVELANAIDKKRESEGKRPAIFIWENVPGVLNSKDNAFGCFLGALSGEDDQLIAPGKKWSNAGCVFGPQRTISWIVKDAQYFGVAQRRRRVFVVASADPRIDTTEILFESEGVRRDSSPSREPRSKVAALTANGVGTCGADDNQAQAGHLIAFGGGNTGGSIDVASACTAHGVRMDFDTETFIASCDTLRAKGFNEESDDASTYEKNPRTLLRTLQKEIGEEAFAKWGLGILDSLQPQEILRSAMHGRGIRPATFSRSWVVYCALSRTENRCGWLLQSLREVGCERCSSQGWKLPEQLSRELGAYLSELSQPGAQASRFMSDLWFATEGPGILREALSAIQEVGRPTDNQEESALRTIQVRRLMVEECEFLQGFPRGFTKISYRDKDETECPDGPRYKAIGNSMAVTVMKWIGERLMMQMNKIAEPVKSVGDFGGSTTPVDIRDLWQTPPQIYQHLNAEFRFSVDLAASSVNRLHEKYITAEMNTLGIDWAGMYGRSWGWLNPPYSSIGPFVEKAIEQQEKGFGTVMLVPADTSVGWFSLALTSVSEVRLITGGRLSFIRADTGRPVNGNNKGSMLLIFSPHKIGARQFGTVDRDTLMRQL